VASSLKLEFEFIPLTSWGVSLAQKLPTKEWDEIRRECYKEANHSCEICKDTGVTLHAHEVWHFDDRKHIQHLDDLVCVCETCHNVIHFGRSQNVYKKPYINKLIAHWARINKKPKEQFLHYYIKAKNLAEKRSEYHYKVMWAKGELL
jgi:5-methylcytosine-specific restriction endonuclease McrA